MDIVTIEDGGWLSDIHISAACKILQLPEFTDFVLSPSDLPPLICITKTAMELTNLALGHFGGKWGK